MQWYPCRCLGIVVDIEEPSIRCYGSCPSRWQRLLGFNTGGTWWRRFFGLRLSTEFNSTAFYIDATSTLPAVPICKKRKPEIKPDESSVAELAKLPGRNPSVSQTIVEHGCWIKKFSQTMQKLFKITHTTVCML